MTTLHAGPSEVGTRARHHPAKRESKLSKRYTESFEEIEALFEGELHQLLKRGSL